MSYIFYKMMLLLILQNLKATTKQRLNPITDEQVLLDKFSAYGNFYLFVYGKNCYGFSLSYPLVQNLAC